MPDKFTNIAKVTKFYVPARNILAWLVVPFDKPKQMVTNNAFEIHKKCGRHVESEAIVPWKHKSIDENDMEGMPLKNIDFPQNIQIVDVENFN